MKHPELTLKGPGATRLPMQRRQSGLKRKRGMRAAGMAAALLGGCITINAPEDAIVIELNINIRQEVIYRLAEDAGNTIEENADIF